MTIRELIGSLNLAVELRVQQLQQDSKRPLYLIKDAVLDTEIEEVYIKEIDLQCSHGHTDFILEFTSTSHAKIKVQ